MTRGVRARLCTALASVMSASAPLAAPCRMKAAILIALSALVLALVPAATANDRDDRRSPSATRRSSGSSSQQRGLRHGQAVPADRRRRALRRADRRAARAVGRRRPREDRPDRRRPREGPLRVPPRLPGRRARSRAATTCSGSGASPPGTQPTAYAHVVTDPDHPGKLALQYWFFYVFNDWNNLHEGDWEMIQLVFDASTAAEALDRTPVEIGYSQHEGAERADWGDDKLELVDGTHPVVHPADGSHANFFGEALYLGSSAKEGVGCDDTRGPHDRRAARSCGRSRAIRPRRARTSRGSRSRGAGASCSPRSSTARPGRT